ncbi:MAG TPA: M4 family metallopeptidase [Nocardioidaceae bacterium]|nr:M4 family metallopeptidase [Nocardioidaceae bacterium]
MRSRSFLAISAAAVLAATTTVVTAGTSSAVAPPVVKQQGQAGAPSGSFALSGQEARDFVLPAHMKQLHTTTLADGSTQTRYQQMVGDATVFGGQITVNSNAAGEATSVVGAYFPGLQPKNDVKLNKGQAKKVAKAQVGARGDWSNELRIDPKTGKLFYEVQSIRAAQRPVRWVDAATGHVTKAFSALAHGEGVGVKGDKKTIDTKPNFATQRYELLAKDLRQKTYDAGNKKNKAPVLMTDADDAWNYVNVQRTSPSQPAGVDAHYYANVVDDFYGDTFSRDSIDDHGMQIISVVHFDKNYCNAFWNGAYMTYGDGDGDSCLPLSGGLDVDGHELTHGVTEFTSNLIYENESGALNEAFSDMMGNTIEFYADENGLDPAAEPDWLIGEDVINAGSAAPGFRNMGDPEQFGDPSHLSNKYTGTEDGGGVHTNSGIANHAYYLTVNGGSNAGCVATEYHEAVVTEDCDVEVPALGVDRAAQIYFAGFTSLPEYANFCDARNATVSTAGDNADAVSLGWEAVGVDAGCAPAVPPPPACKDVPDASLPIESNHPYSHNVDCTWTYDNGAAGFSFHFTLLDMEEDYDYVYVKDADGTILDTYTGTANGEFDSSCIPTSTGSVQMVTDPAVKGAGFTVDSVTPC